MNEGLLDGLKVHVTLAGDFEALDAVDFHLGDVPFDLPVELGSYGHGVIEDSGDQ